MALRRRVVHCLLQQTKKCTVTNARKSSNSTTNLKEAIAAVIPEKTNIVNAFRDKYGNEKVGDVTVNMMYRGMRGITGLVNEISDVDVEGGIRFRGHTVEECRLLLPKSPNGQEPLPEGFFWLLCTGHIPNDDQVAELSKEWAQRAQLPPHVADMLNKFPGNLHAMSQFCAAVTACNSESKFVQAYRNGLAKESYWEYMYEDAMDMIAKLPTIAAIIYRNLYRDGRTACAIDPSKDWAWNFCSSIGYDKPKLREYMRLYFSVNSEHDGGSVCNHTSRLVGSALSDAYLSFSSGVAGLAGPRHGAANQEALVYLTKVQRDLGTNYTMNQLQDYIWATIRSGQVIPGYGHAVLRKPDPRYLAHQDFLKKYFPDDPLFKVSSDLYKLVPDILQEDGRAQNPWPNVDAVSGIGLYHYGLTEVEYHPVLIGMSRSLGSMASLIWDRILGMPIERPKSLSTENLMKMVKAN